MRDSLGHAPPADRLDAERLLQRGIPASLDHTPDPEAQTAFRASTATTGVEFDSMPMDVSDFRDVMNVFQKHSDITHAIHLAYVMGPLSTRTFPFHAR